MSLENLRKDVEAHLSERHDDTPFSSWAADLGIAMSYAGTSKSAMIAVLDTTYCTSHTAVFNVPTLHAAGIAPISWAYEYLVYGPVLGAAYCFSVSVQDIRKAGSTPHVFDFTTSNEVNITAKHLEFAKQVASLFLHEVFPVAGSDLFLTVFAAELSRQKSPNNVYGPAKTSSWSLKDTRTIIESLSGRIEDAAFCNMHPLVNSKTLSTGLSQLEGMVSLLVTLNMEISKISSEWMDKMRPREDLQTMTPRPLERKDRDSIASSGSTTLQPKTGFEDVFFDKFSREASAPVVEAIAGTKPHRSKRARPTIGTKNFKHTATKIKSHSAVKPTKHPVYDHPEPFFIAGKKEWKFDCVLASRVKRG